MTTKFQPFYKMHALRCAGCPYTIEVPRRRLANGIRDMVAHVADRSHASYTRSERIIDGVPE
jgi:alcohol dehydrogenase YqhD (iron-dependent ADH family)